MAFAFHMRSKGRYGRVGGMGAVQELPYPLTVTGTYHKVANATGTDLVFCLTLCSGPCRSVMEKA